MAAKVYEYFRSEPIIINGKFARMVDAMWVQNRIQDSKFQRLVDLYAIAAITGLKIGSRLPDDTSTPEKRTILVDQLSNNYTRFITILQTILLLDESRGLEPAERARMAFDTNPKTEDEYRANMNLFNSYARGGIEHLYNRLVLRPLGFEDEFTDARVSNIYEFIKNPEQMDDEL